MTVILVLISVTLFAVLCGVATALLSKRSNPDLAAAVLRGFITTGAVIAGTFGVLGVLTLLV
ncbi:hypothetical protein AB0H71_31740 [Nocardia sp. NPDC050697]|uniref:hypothetical protein n=1 Tax=Nocardia sp. NPDC050697 TaxID=3155158 RepID=UPI00340C6ABC